ncbi:hypothetical protein [Erwinia rhapontici]|uniref:hypothetical protein n=1 Tax=Erwinia rhapontici TaxID=55212 RepID=UPI00133170B8|nr:hypothetical protein [Erwinia rhapontici]MBP2155721.1 chromosome segregation ATPase [Erwinia rhapontici]
MSETTEIAVLEIKPEQAPSVYVANGLNTYLEQIRQAVNEVPDLSTPKGRARVASLAAQVSRSKTLIEKPGRDYLRHLKEAVKPAEAELRRFVTECDNLRDEVRRPLTEWESEQERIKAEQQMLDWHTEALADNEAWDKVRAERIEADHEIALLLNDKFDRDAAEAERQRIAREQEIARNAVEQARREAETQALREREAAAQREADLKAAKEKAEADAKAAQERAENEAREAQERTTRLAQKARQLAEREKQQAVEAEQRKAADAETARLAEEKRIANEAARRAADVAHRKAIGTLIVNNLIGHAGLTREQAIATLTAIKDNCIPHTSITY